MTISEMAVELELLRPGLADGCGLLEAYTGQTVMPIYGRDGKPKSAVWVCVRRGDNSAVRNAFDAGVEPGLHTSGKIGVIIIEIPLPAEITAPQLRQRVVDASRQLRESFATS